MTDKNIQAPSIHAETIKTEKIEVLDDDTLEFIYNLKHGKVLSEEQVDKINAYMKQNNYRIMKAKP